MGATCRGASAGRCKLIKFVQFIVIICGYPVRYGLAGLLYWDKVKSSFYFPQ